MTNDTPIVNAQMLIRTPPEKVFEALVNPDITSRFWFTHSSGRLEVGKTIRWRWEMYDVETDVRVEQATKNKLHFWWGMPGTQGTEVVITMEPYGDNQTFVKVAESGFANDENLITTLMGQTGGWYMVLCTLKALLEHTIILTAVADHAPAGK